MAAAPAFELHHPGPEQFCGKVEHLQQRGRRRTGFVQPAVEYLLHGPRGFPEFGEADHPAAALEGMEAAPDHD